jgi:2-keto-4-pentenoate hydratase/2-oxohepta-3-ene-1,7-dioic acid hydratase in catechol pathway
VVIGKKCRSISPDEARSAIGGYMVANDVSVRDWQFRTSTVTLGKSFDTHGPTGPWLTLAHEIPDPHDLGLRTFVNGERRQDGNTRHLIYGIYEQISYLSQVMTLKPGDILATGTPAGVGLAFDPPKYLSPGDVVRLEIDGVGHIENHVVKG